MAYTPITSGEVDEDSPITEGLLQTLRNNQAYHQGLFDESTGHNHDGDTDDGAPITSFPEDVAADGNVTVGGTLTAANFTDWLAIFGAW